ncbi:hypothetical protein GCM10009827_069960 [Dactylosporangium maewongense]|uniref:Uncharacterized protein n=1 Tax=Dactylosporangium maewongense TaxID=634393 RepID=A0ABN2BGN6_9ACTN
MSAGAKAMQILFIIAGTFAIAFGTLGSMAEADDTKNAQWTCYPPARQGDAQNCRGELSGGDLTIATNFILAGIGLMIAGAACAIGGRRDAAAPPVPFAVPGQPPFPPRPVPPGSPVVPTQAPPPPAWPSA